MSQQRCFTESGLSKKHANFSFFVKQPKWAYSGSIHFPRRSSIEITFQSVEDECYGAFRQASICTHYTHTIFDSLSLALFAKNSVLHDACPPQEGLDRSPPVTPTESPCRKYDLEPCPTKRLKTAQRASASRSPLRVVSGRTASIRLRPVIAHFMPCRHRSVAQVGHDSDCPVAPYVCERVF